MTLILFLFWLAIIVFVIAGMWKAFEKAGQPGWAAIVPIYNYYIRLKIADKPGWWLLLFLIPIVNIIFLIMTYIEVAKRFGKDTGFGVGMAFLPFIFWPILGFGDAQFQHDSLGDEINNIGNN